MKVCEGKVCVCVGGGGGGGGEKGGGYMNEGSTNHSTRQLLCV